MGTKDERDPNSLLRDLWNETSPVTRVCLFGGLLIGLIIAVIYLGSFGPEMGLSRRGGAGLWALLAFGLLLASGFVGLLIGVLIELVAGKILGLRISRKELSGRRKHRRRE